MGKEVNTKTDAEIFAAPKRNMLEVTIGLNQMTANVLGVNGYKLRNDLFLARDKKQIGQQNGRVMSATAVAQQAQAQRNANAATLAQQNAALAAKVPRQVLYKQGVTVVGATAAMLKAEAANTDLDHSRKLMCNYLVANPGIAKLLETDAHHIVAWLAALAAQSRRILFSVGIGVNDTDNCAILPRFLTTTIAGMPNASAHQFIHTLEYYTNVYFDLTNIPSNTQAEVHVALRAIRTQLIAGTFPY